MSSGMESPHAPDNHSSSSQSSSSSSGSILNAALSVSSPDGGAGPEGEERRGMVPETLSECLNTLSRGETGDFYRDYTLQQDLSPRAQEKFVSRRRYPRPSIALSSEASSSTLPTNQSSFARRRLPISHVQEGLHGQAEEDSVAEAEIEMELMDGQGSRQGLGVAVDTMEEQEVESMIQRERWTLLTKSTVAMYERYQRHWVDWCYRKGYPDYNVYCKKFQRYMAENLADEPDPAKGIEPLRVNPKVRSHQPAAYDPDQPLPSYETVDAYIKAVIDLYVTQKSDPTNKAMQDEPHPRSVHVRTLMKKYQLKMATLKKSVVSTDQSFDERNDLEVLKQTMRTSWTHKYRHLGGGRKHDLIGLRTRLNAAWSQYMVIGGESVRMATLADLATHTVHAASQGNDGEQNVIGISLSIPRGRINREDKENKGTIVRSKDVEVCPIGAFALYLFELWMHPRTPPDFSDHSWAEIFILHTGDPLKQMSSSSQHKHANRPTQAHWQWSADHVATHYMDRDSAQMALKMAGCTLPRERLWLARNTLIPPVELQRQAFPFIEHYFQDSEDWLIWTYNIMMDRDIFENRPSNTRMAIQKQDIPKLRVLLLLTHLRKVLLQDAAVLINLQTSDFRYGEHQIFRDRLFGSALFLEFQGRLLHSIDTSRSPVSDNLTPNAPSINHESRSLHMQDEHNSRVLNDILKIITDARNERKDDLQETISILNARIDDRFSALVSFAYDISSGLTHAVPGLSQKGQQSQGADDQAFQSQNQQHANSLRQLQQNQIEMLQFLRNMAPSTQLMKAQELQIEIIQKTQQMIQPYRHQPRALQFLARAQYSREGRPLPSEEEESAMIVEQELEVEQDQEMEQEHQEEDHIDEQEEQSEILEEGAALDPPDEEQALQLLQQPQPQPDDRGIGDQMDQMEEALAYPRHQPPFIVDYSMLGRDDPLRDQWKEWFFGLNGQPSLWQLNKYYKSKWRKGSDQKANTRSKQFYYKRRLIRSVLKTSLRKPGSTLELRVEAALKSIEEQLQTMSMNQYVKSLGVEG